MSEEVKENIPETENVEAKKESKPKKSIFIYTVSSSSPNSFIISSRIEKLSYCAIKFS